MSYPKPALIRADMRVSHRSLCKGNNIFSNNSKMNKIISFLNQPERFTLYSGSCLLSTFAPELVEFSRSRVVYRSNNNANSNGGVSYANANNDSSNTNANIGSRLANNQNNFNRRTTQGTGPQCRAEGNKPQQQRWVILSLVRRKAEKLNGRVEFGRSSRLEELRPKEGRH